MSGMTPVEFTWGIYYPTGFIPWRHNMGAETDLQAFTRRLDGAGEGDRLMIRYDNGQLCTFRRRDQSSLK